VVTDIAAEVRDILVFHLGSEESLIADDARLLEDLGADSLDLVEVVMSCEERFDIHIANRVATRFVTVGDVVHFIEAQLATGGGPGPVHQPAPPPIALGTRLRDALARHLRPRTILGI
jgi:acyl carrier protein